MDSKVCRGFVQTDLRNYMLKLPDGNLKCTLYSVWEVAAGTGVHPIPVESKELA